MTPTRIALPVPRPGTALTEEGDAYVASLDVAFRVGDREVVLDGTTFEDLTIAAGLRHLAFHPRTRVPVASTLPAAALARRIESGWASVDSHGVTEAARRVIDLCAEGGEVSWRVANAMTDDAVLLEDDASPLAPQGSTP